MKGFSYIVLGSLFFYNSSFEQCHHKTNEKDTVIQTIKPNSEWHLSKAIYSKEKIIELNNNITADSFKAITSIVVIKEGELLIEEYFNGATRNTLHNTRSVGKSFTSALMGIAIEEGFIKSENERLGDFYNLKQFANYTPKKDSITLKDLLTMSSAYNGSDANSNSPGNEENMYPTNNWVKFALDLPMDNIKSNGKQWDYFTAGVILLGDILNKSVPNGLEKFANEKLFKHDAERERGDVEEQHVLDLALEHAALDGGANRDHLVGVDPLVRLLAEELLHHRLHSRHPGHAADQDDAVDVLLRDLPVLERDLARLDRALDQVVD